MEILNAVTGVAGILVGLIILPMVVTKCIAGFFMIALGCTVLDGI